MKTDKRFLHVQTKDRLTDRLNNYPAILSRVQLYRQTSLSNSTTPTTVG